MSVNTMRVAGTLRDLLQPQSGTWAGKGYDAHLTGH